MTNSGQKGSGIEESTNRDGADQVKILLVDDLKDNLLALEGLLGRDDVEILKAKSGTDALELMVLHEFALALIDVQMPGMSGFELAELMRGTNKTRDVPIIFVSATAKDQTFSFKGYESGAVDFLLKPLDSHAVKSKVNIFIELHRKTNELKRIQKELEQALQIRDEFISIASHELKTPLTSLKIQTALRKRDLQRGALSTFTQERLAKMFDTDERQLERISHLIDDMLDISRINSGKLSMNFESFDLCELVRDLIGRSSEQFVAAGCPVDFSNCQPVMGSWDRFRIEQVLTNLLTNAVRYGAGKPVFIQVNASSEHARIVVRDQGRGIAKENHARIFQRFERAVSGSEISGLGLGLFIVSQIVEAHHGSIRVDSELGQGSTFVVELPVIKLSEGDHPGF